MQFHVLDTNGLVVNTIEMEEGVEYDPGEGLTLHPFVEGVTIGDTKSGETWDLAPREKVPPPPIETIVRSALAATDVVATRCMKAGVAFGDDWNRYTDALRGFLKGGCAGGIDALPVQPKSYPAGS